ncbi:MAG: hypothetical protein MK102_06790 [Fuerstiella sp.]|nr:hypothetical protein [Fuerstiella sp.]
MTNYGNKKTMNNTVQELSKLQGAFLHPELIGTGPGGPERLAKLQNKALGLIIRYILMEQGAIPK